MEEGIIISSQEVFDEISIGGDDLEKWAESLDFDKLQENLKRAEIYDFFDEFDKDLEEDEEFDGDFATVSGWVMHTLEGEVEEGDTFDYEELRITVLEFDERRIEKIAVEILPEPDEDEEEEEDD